MRIGKRKKENKKSLQEFFIWALTDDKVVLKILFTIAFWGGILILFFTTLLFIYFNFWVGVILDVLLLIFAFKKLFDFKKNGGIKMLEGMTMGNLVYGEKKMKEVFKK